MAAVQEKGGENCPEERCCDARLHLGPILRLTLTLAHTQTKQSATSGVGRAISLSGRAGPTRSRGRNREENGGGGASAIERSILVERRRKRRRILDKPPPRLVPPFCRCPPTAPIKWSSSSFGFFLALKRIPSFPTLFLESNQSDKLGSSFTCSAEYIILFGKSCTRKKESC